MGRTIKFTSILLIALAVVNILVSCQNTPGKLNYDELVPMFSNEKGFSSDIFIWPEDEYHDKLLADGKVIRTSEELSVAKITPLYYELKQSYVSYLGDSVIPWEGDAWFLVLITYCSVDEVIESGASAKDVKKGGVIKVAIPMTMQFDCSNDEESLEVAVRFLGKLTENAEKQYGKNHKEWEKNHILVDLDLKKDYPEIRDKIRISHYRDYERGSFSFVPEKNVSYYAILDSQARYFGHPAFYPSYSFENDKMLYYSFEPFDSRYDRDYKIIVRGFPADGSVLPKLEDIKNTNPDWWWSQSNNRVRLIYDQNIRLYELIASGKKVLYGSD